jgi:hypothetical protein
MPLALDSQYPLQGIIWTLLIAFGLGLFFYTLFFVLRDLFRRDNLSAWGKTAWVVFVLVLPLVGALAYLISQSGAMGERRLRRLGVTELRMDSHVHSLSESDGYRGSHDVAYTRQAWSGPMRGV